MDNSIILYAGMAALAIGLLMHFKAKAILLVLTLAFGGLTYVSWDMGHVIDETTGIFAAATAITGLILYGAVKGKLGKSSGKSKAKAAA